MTQVNFRFGSVAPETDYLGDVRFPLEATGLRTSLGVRFVPITTKVHRSKKFLFDDLFGCSRLAPQSFCR
jgi:hypothetical protein